MLPNIDVLTRVWSFYIEGHQRLRVPPVQGSVYCKVHNYCIVPWLYVISTRSYLCLWHIDCLTTSSNDLLVTSNLTTSSFFFVSFLRAWSWVTMVISHPFTCEGRKVPFEKFCNPFLTKVMRLSLLGVTVLYKNYWRHRVGSFHYTPALFCLPPLIRPLLQDLWVIPWSRRCPLTHKHKQTNTHEDRKEHFLSCHQDKEELRAGQ